MSFRSSLCILSSPIYSFSGHLCIPTYCSLSWLSDFVPRGPIRSRCSTHLWTCSVWLLAHPHSSQVPVPKKTFYLQSSVAPPIRISQNFSTKQQRTTALSERQKWAMKSRKEYLLNQNIISYQHLQLQTFQTQTPRHYSENTINTSKDNISQLEPRISTTAGPKYLKIAEP